jgi:hypothetical protein
MKMFSTHSCKQCGAGGPESFHWLVSGDVKMDFIFLFIGIKVIE